MVVKQNENSSTMFSRESRSFRNKDSVKGISLKGARSLSLNRERRNVCPNSGSIFNSNEESDNGDKNNVFTIRRFSRWGNTGSLQHLNNTGTHIHRTSLDSDVNNDWKFQSFRSEGLQNTGSGNMQVTRVDFKTLVTMFLKRSSIYALNQVGNSSTKRRKIFWAFILIFGLLGSGIQIVQYLTAYFSYPVVVNMDSVSSMNQEFPAVTICNLNRIRKKFVPCLKKHINHTDCNPSEVEDINLFLTLDNDNGTHCTNDYYSKIDEELLHQFVWQSLFTKLTPESQEYYGHQKDKFIRSCSFNGEKCSSKDFSNGLDFVYGNCFTFNMASNDKKPFNTSFVGPNGGLEVELDLEVDEYADYTRSIGARVEVHDPYHNAIMSEKGINVSPGFENSIALSKYQTLRLPEPYKDHCMMYETGEGLHKCLYICQNSLLQNKCSCVMDKSVNVRQCDLSKLSDFCCVYKPQQYTCDCPLPCEDTDYLTSIFSAVWPSQAYYDALYSTKETNHTLENYRTNRLKLKVFYDTLETLIYKQKPMYQSSELFSQIGGQMGLWLGLSLVAIFECIENFVLLWQYRAKYSNK